MNLPLPDDLTIAELFVELIPVEYTEWDQKVDNPFDSKTTCFRCYKKGWWPLGLARYTVPCCGRVCRWCHQVDYKAHANECMKF